MITGKQCVSASSDLDFTKYIRPWAEFFLVKNEQSEAVALSPSFAIYAGYKNPIDYLGENDHSLRCPARKLADQFMTQDRMLIKTNSKETHLCVTTFSNKKLNVYLTTKECFMSHMVCNIQTLNVGIIAEQLYATIKSIDPKYHAHINKSYKVVNTYADLSVRETQIIHYLMQRKSSTDIAAILQLSKRTIQHYVENMKFKMFCNTTQQLIELGMLLEFNNKIPASLLKLTG